MKKQLLLSGLTALTMLFALTGLTRAQHTFTFNPPSGSTVSAGEEIEVTCTPATEGEVVYCWFSSMEEAQAAQPDKLWDPYEEEKPTVSAGKTVLAVAVNDGSFAEPDFKNVAYAEYTLDGNAAVPQLMFPDLTTDKYGMYVPFHAALTLGGEEQDNFEVYYSLYGNTPSKAAYDPDDDEIMLARGTDGSAEIIIPVAAAPAFKAIAYITVDGEEVASNLVEMELTAYEVAKPEFVPATPTLGALEVEANTVVKIKDNTLTGEGEETGATILYSMDGATLPLESAYYVDDNPNVFLYNDEEGIKITEDVTIWVIAYKSVGGDGFGLAPTGGSEMLRGRFTVAKPTVRVSLSTEEWTLGSEELPTVNVTVPEGITLGTAEGDAAVKLYIYNDNPNNGWKQIITDSGTALDMSTAIEANRIDFWTIQCSLVKGNDTAKAFEGDMTVTPEFLWLSIVKAGDKPAAPQFSVPSGEVDSGTQVTLTCTTEGATIYYTYGTEFVTTPYTTPFVITSDCSIRARAEKDGIESDIVSATYRLKRAALPEPTVTLTPAPGEIEAGTEIEIEVDAEKVSNEKISAIYYRLYPSEDSANNDKNPIANVGSQYPADGKPVPTVENPVLRVGVFRSQESPYEIRQWDYAVFTYTIMKDIPMPVISPAGGEVEKGTEVEITLAEGAEGSKIYYTTNDSLPQVGKDFTQEYTQKIVVNQTMTIKAMAVKSQTGDRDLVSNVAVATYQVKEPETPATAVAKPTFSVAAGEVEKGTKVALACTTEGAKIYYTVNGEAPTAASIEYTAEISIDSAMTIKAIAVKEGMENSEMAEVAYTIKSVSNQTYELAGVNIYPNPAEGEFKVNVPERARIEIFGMNGAKVMSREVNAGVEAFRLNSGIYFVRVTAGNKTAVKRVVVL